MQVKISKWKTLGIYNMLSARILNGLVFNEEMFELRVLCVLNHPSLVLSESTVAVDLTLYSEV